MPKLMMLLAAVALLAVVTFIKVTPVGEGSWVCNEGEWVPMGSPVTPKPVSMCNQGSQFNWERAMQYMNDCKVVKVAQAKNLKIKIYFKDGTYKTTTEPKIDEVVNLAKHVSLQCKTKVVVVKE